MSDGNNIPIYAEDHRWLSEIIASDILSVTGGEGAAERRQTAAALFGAERILLENGMVRAADELVKFSPSTLTLPPVTPPLLWIEYSPAARSSLRDITHPYVSGILLMRDPHHEDILLLMSGWGESADLSKTGMYPCLAKWSFSALSSLDRLTLSEKDITAAADFGMSPGMRDDMNFRFRITGEHAAETEKNAYWRVSRELGFTAAVLSLLATRNTVLHDMDDNRASDAGSVRASLAPSGTIIKKISRQFRHEGGIWKPPFGRPVWLPKAQGAAPVV